MVFDPRTRQNRHLYVIQGVPDEVECRIEFVKGVQGDTTEVEGDEQEARISDSLYNRRSMNLLQTMICGVADELADA
jgi:hypothetical protein